MSEGTNGKGGGAGKREFGALISAGRRAFGTRLLFAWLAVSLAVLTVFAGRLAWDDTVTVRELVPLGIFSCPDSRIRSYHSAHGTIRSDDLLDRGDAVPDNGGDRF